MTQAMIDNGGLVVVARSVNFNHVNYGAWIPLVASRDLAGLEVLGITGTSGPGHVSQSRRAITLSPVFSASTTSYTAAVAETVKRIRIKPTADEPLEVTVTVAGEETTSGRMGGLIELAAVGTGKVINIAVKPKDARPAKTYSVMVTREAATITASSSSVNATVGTAITNVTFSSSGAGFAPTFWYVDPALPQGISIDSGTGTISGTPQRAAVSATYTVTGIGGLSVSAFGEQLLHQATATVTIEVGTAVSGAGATVSGLTSGGLTMDEGDTASYTVRLTQVPTGTVTVTPMMSGSSSVTVSGALTFETDDTNGKIWSRAQSFTVTAGSDGDAADEAVVIKHVASGGGYGGVAIADVTVTVDDDEEVGLRVTGTTVTDGSHALSVNEGSTKTYSVALGSEPGSSVTVTPTVAPAFAPGGGVGGDVSVSPGSLTFDSTNWATARDVTVTAGQDGDFTDDTVKIWHSMSSADSYYGGSAGPSVAVTVKDDDGVGVTLQGDTTVEADGSHTFYKVDAGDTVTYSIKLNTEPTGDVTIRPSAGGSSSVVLETKFLSFTELNWNEAQKVNVVAVDGRVVITHTISGGGYGGVSVPSVTVTTLGKDNADLSGLSVVAMFITTDRMPGPPVTPAVYAEAAVTLGQAVSAGRTLYTAKVSNGVVKMKVTPTAADPDATIKVNGAEVASGSESDPINIPLRDGGSFGILIAVVAEDGVTEKRYRLQVTRRSGDAFLSGISVKSGTEELTLGRVEGDGMDAVTVAGFSGAETAYTVRAPQAATSVEVTPVTSDPRATVTVAGNAVSRTASGTLSATTVPLSSSPTSVIIEVTPEDSGETAKTYTVTVTKSAMRVSVDPVSLTVEEGSMATYSVVLTSAPTTGTVTVTPTSGDRALATVVGAALTFTTSTWDTAQTVTVTGVDDAVDNRRIQSTTVTHVVSSSGGTTGYEGAVAASVSVAVNDDEITKVFYIEDVEALENAGTLDFPVNLGRAADSEVTVEWTHAVRPDDASQATPGTATEGDYDASGASGTLTFAVGERAKTISIPINDDEEEEGNEKVLVLLHNPSSSGDDLLGVSGSPATGTIRDDDGAVDRPTPDVDAGGPSGSVVFSVSGGGEVAEGASGTTARAEFTVSLSRAESLQVSVGYATADGTAEAASDYESASGTVTFSPGETSRTVSVTVNGDDEAEGNETFTLGLTASPNGQVDQQNSSARAVITNDDRKTVSAGMSGEFQVGETTVAVESTLPDDTELEVVLPLELESGGTAIEELTVTLGPTDAEIDADRFGYTGSGADHVLVDIDVSPVPDDAVRICLPITEGLRRAAGQRRLYLIRFSGGTWEELSSETEGDAVCADVRGFSPFALVFEIEDYARRRAGDVNRAILPELSRAMTASTLEAITSRIDDAMAGGGTANAFDAQAPLEPGYGRVEAGLRLGELEDGETLSLPDAVDGSYYSVSLAGVQQPPRGESGAERVPAPAGAGDLGMWISGDYRSLSGKGGGLVDWDGRLLSGHLGADYRFGQGFLAGVATSWSHGSFDYTGRGEGSARVSGDYASRMNSFHPYLGLSLSERLGLWAAGGWGFGEIKIDDAEIAARQKASTRLGTLATGADLKLLGGGGGASALSLRGEAWISRVKVKGNGDRVEGLSVKTNRLRAALEGSHALYLGSGSSLVPSLEFAMRRDGGDGETGVGGELGGGISFMSSMGLAVEARGRGLLFHQGDAKEWGLGGSVRFDPGGDGRGLSMSVLPSWGDSASGVQSLWESETAVDLGVGATRREFGLETEVGYGFPALGDRGLLTPYGAFGRSGGDGRNYGVGSRLSMGRTLDLTLEGRRRELQSGDPEHELTLQGRLNW